MYNNPGGGNGDDYTEVCTIATDPDNQTEYVWWKSGDDETASGFEKHKIGLIHPRNTQVVYGLASQVYPSHTLVDLNFDDIYRVIGYGLIRE